MSIIKIPDEIWYAQRRINTNQNADNTLAYMTYSDHTKASEKKRATGRRWAGTGCREFTLSNLEPLEGFILGDAVSRYSTSNKLVRVKDPRGFTVEMFIHDLVHLLENCTVEKGVIQEACRWGQNGKGHILIPEGSDMEKTVEYILSMKKTPNLDPMQLRIGDKYVTTTGDMVVYGGRWRLQGEITHTFTRQPSWQNQQAPAQSISVTQTFDLEKHICQYYSGYYIRDIAGYNQSKVIGIYETIPISEQDVADKMHEPYYWDIPVSDKVKQVEADFRAKHKGQYVSKTNKVELKRKTFIH